MAHLKRMLISYVLEIGKMDVEIAVVLRKKPTVQPKEAPSDISKMKMGKIIRDNWSVMYQTSTREDLNVQKCLFFLLEKHLYSISLLKYILGITKQYKPNDVADKKCFADMIKWYIIVRNTLLALMPKLFKVQKRQPQ